MRAPDPLDDLIRLIRSHIRIERTTRFKTILVDVKTILVDAVPTIAREHYARVLPTLPLPGFGTSVRSVPVRHAAPHVFSGDAGRNSASRSAIVGRLAWSGSGNEAVS
jgi:hypothetical protein